MEQQTDILDDDQISDLAKASAHWLAYKRLTGFEHLFSEASLLTPISEYLFGKGWTVDAEVDCKTTFEFEPESKATKTSVYYDLLAKKNDTKLICEMKFLNGNDARVIHDILKLAIPPRDSAQRLMLIALKRGHDSSIIDQLRTGKKLITGGTRGSELYLGDKPFTAGGDDTRKAIQRTLEFAPNLHEIDIEDRTHASSESERVFIFSISRN